MYKGKGLLAPHATRQTADATIDPFLGMNKGPWAERNIFKKGCSAGPSYGGEILNIHKVR